MLVNGANEMEGRVEVCYNEEYVTVCQAGFDVQAATIVCSQLGFSRRGRVSVINSGTFNGGPSEKRQPL